MPGLLAPPAAARPLDGGVQEGAGLPDVRRGAWLVWVLTVQAGSDAVPRHPGRRRSLLALRRLARGRRPAPARRWAGTPCRSARSRPCWRSLAVAGGAFWPRYAEARRSDGPPSADDAGLPTSPTAPSGWPSCRPRAGRCSSTTPPPGASAARSTTAWRSPPRASPTPWQRTTSPTSRPTGPSATRRSPPSWPATAAPGVPLYLVYGAKGGEPAILPAILTEGVVVKALDAAAKPPSTDPKEPDDVASTAESPRPPPSRWPPGRARARRARSSASRRPPSRPRTPTAGPLAGRLQGQDRGAGVDQQRLPLCPEALQLRPHAGPAEGGDRRGRGLADDHLVGAGLPGLPDRRRRPRPWKAKVGAASTDVLLDPKGTVGRAYDARTTPHMYVIDRTGTLVYMGGIDDQADRRSRQPEGREELRRRRPGRREGRPPGGHRPSRGPMAAA